MDDSWWRNLLFRVHKSLNFRVQSVSLLLVFQVLFSVFLLFPFFFTNILVIVSAIPFSSLFFLCEKRVEKVILTNNTIMYFIDNFVNGDWLTELLSYNGISLVDINKILIFEHLRDLLSELPRFILVIRHPIAQEITDESQEFFRVLWHVFNDEQRHVGVCLICQSLTFDVLAHDGLYLLQLLLMGQ